MGRKSAGSFIRLHFYLQLVISTFYIFVRIIVFAYAGQLLLKAMKRRGEYRHMWRTSAIAVTVPFLLTIILDFFPFWDHFSTLLTSLVHFAYIASRCQVLSENAKMNNSPFRSYSVGRGNFHENTTTRSSIILTFHFIRMDLAEGTIPLASFIMNKTICEEQTK